MATILVVDDDSDIRSLLTDFLTNENHLIQTAADGSEALHMVESRPFDLALVDIWLLGMSGIELLEHLRDLAPEMPVVVITCHPAYETAVQALRSGACDYVEKPFDLKNLRTTVRKALEQHCPPEQIRVGELVVDLLAGKVRRGEQLLTLTPTELAILAYLARRSGQIVTFDELLVHVWHCRSEVGSKEQVRTVVWRLRQKIEQDPTRPRWLVTVRGMGYRLETSPNEGSAP
jgi:DNA-binding response OmpR family regulator